MNALDKLILEARAQREQDDEAHFARIQRQNGDLTLLFNEIEGSTLAQCDGWEADRGQGTEVILTFKGRTVGQWSSNAKGLVFEFDGGRRSPKVAADFDGMLSATRLIMERTEGDGDRERGPVAGRLVAARTRT